MKYFLLVTLLFTLSAFPQQKAIEETIQGIMARDILGIITSRNNEIEKELKQPDRSNLPQNPLSDQVSQFPVTNQIPSPTKILSPQTVSTNFTAATLTGSTANTNSFPPDDMGAVGPSQYIIFVNGRIATYNKATGLADGVLNISPDVFFASVMSTNPNTFTSDPRIRYDRLTKRWFMIIIDVPAGTGALPNRVLFAVSSDSIITGTTVMRFFFFQHDLVSPAGNTGSFFDYPTLGIDNNALYIGGNVFSSIGSFQATTAFVVNKVSILGNGPLVAYAFRNLVAGTGAGPYTPQGVDNFDPAATEGYLIGVDNATFGTMMLRRISNPGGVPSISANIGIVLPTTYYPLTVPHLGNTGGTNGNIDALDDRIFAAVMRNGRLWTAHTIRVTSAGVASSSTVGTRNAVRWYEFQNISAPGTPTVFQSGTIYDGAATNPRFYWNPTIMISGQGHAAVGFSTAGAAESINAGTTGRLVTDVTGTMQSPPFLYTSSSTAYNPISDPGGAGGRRWGDYSYVSVDPQDDMTMWVVQQFCNAANNYGCRVAKLLAPPPPVLISSTPAIVPPGNSIDITIEGQTNTGGFFDPGSQFFRRISATIDGGITVNSITYVSPSTVTLNIATTGAVNGARTVTITNPDGQITTSASILTYNSSLPVELISFTGKVIRRNEIKLNWATATEQNAQKFEIQSSTDNLTWNKVGEVNASGNSNSYKNYSLVDKSVKQLGIYKYRIKQYDNDGQFEILNSIEVAYTYIPGEFSLKQNYPNPFNPETKITYDVAERNNIVITVFDILGNEITKLVNEVKDPGSYEIFFNASALSNGVYLYRMQTDNYLSVQKMIVLK